LSSFENEIDKLNSKIIGLTTDIERRRRISNIANTEDIVNTIECYENEIINLKNELVDVNKKMADTMDENARYKETLRESEIRRAELEETLTVLAAVGENNKLSDEAQSILVKIQSLWLDMGTPIVQREALRYRISRCLEDTCLRELSEATALHERSLKSLETRNRDYRSMLLALDVPEDPDFTKRISDARTLGERTEMVDLELMRLRPQYQAAAERRARLVDELDGLIQTMNLTVDTLSENINRLHETKRGRLRNNKRALLRKSKKLSPQIKSSKDERERILKEVEEIVNALDAPNAHSVELQSYGGKLLERLAREDDSIPTISEDSPPGSLSNAFLDDCDKDIKSLKAIKSQTHVSNAMIRNDARQIAKDMHLRSHELLPVVVASITARMKKLPTWWNIETATEVSRSILSKEAVICVKESFTKHLCSILESLKSISGSRKCLTDILNKVVREAQVVLLSTVESEIGSTEAHSSFQLALNRLPSLSKEYAQACVDEIHQLLGAVDAMTQSEIEALTVLWEAFGVGISQRGLFWDKIEDMASDASEPIDNPFSQLLTAYGIDTEEWIYEITNKSVNFYIVLRAKLLKLSIVHNEVEKLKSQQDLKSSIITVDSEIRMMNAKLAEFEAKASDRQRLTNKKINSATLLEEERFRRQIQASFSTKLQNLANKLHDWEEIEGYPFDYTILSDEVKVLLENRDKSKEWVEQRTAFMHLKTVKQNVRKRAILDRPAHSTSRSTGQSPLRSRPTSAQKSDDRMNRVRNANVSPNRIRPISRGLSPNNLHSYHRSVRSPTKERIVVNATASKGGISQESLPQQSNALCKSSKSNSPPPRKVTPYSSANKDSSIADANHSGKRRAQVILPFGNFLSTSPTSKENNNIAKW